MSRKKREKMIKTFAIVAIIGMIVSSIASLFFYL
jgi:hypothetical protein